LNLADIPDNRAEAQNIVNQINTRIFCFKDYDPQKLNEYIFGDSDLIKSSTNSNPSSRRKLEPTLDELWEKFAIESLRLKKIDESTYEELYTRIGKILRGLSTQSLRDAKDIFATIQSKYAEISCYYILRRLSACCEWAVDEGKISINPFKKLVKGLPVPKFGFNPDPFSEEEVERILAAFAAHPEYKRYVLYIILNLRLVVVRQKQLGSDGRTLIS
jgi:integrase